MMYLRTFQLLAALYLCLHLYYYIRNDIYYDIFAYVPTPGWQVF